MTGDLIKDVDEAKYITHEFPLGDQSGHIAVESIPASSTKSAAIHTFSTLEDANVAALSAIISPVGQKTSPRGI